MKFTVKRDSSGTAHILEIEPRPWAKRSIVSRDEAADRSWVIGAQRFLKANWPKGLTGAKLEAELIHLISGFVYGGPSKVPISAEAAGVKEGDSAEEVLAKLRRAGAIS